MDGAPWTPWKPLKLSQTPSATSNPLLPIFAGVFVPNRENSHLKSHGFAVAPRAAAFGRCCLGRAGGGQGLAPLSGELCVSGAGGGGLWGRFGVLFGGLAEKKSRAVPGLPGGSIIYQTLYFPKRTPMVGGWSGALGVHPGDFLKVATMTYDF